MGARLLLLAAAALAMSGTFAIGQSIAGGFLPHDQAWLGMSAAELGRFQDGRIVAFMVHDRVSFGGTLIAVAILYGWLVRGPLARGERWAWWTLALSGAAGFASFLAWLGYGYLDTWHGAATLLLLPVFAGGLLLTRPPGLVARPWRWSSATGRAVGPGLVLLASAGMAVAGLVILAIGATTVFVPQDLAFIGAGVPFLCEIHPGLVPLIAHDRAGFGGGLVATGIAAVGVAAAGRPSVGRWAALASAAGIGFGAAIGVHVAVGYTDLTHLGPAVAGALVLAAGLGLVAPRELVSRRPLVAAA